MTDGVVKLKEDKHPSWDTVLTDLKGRDIRQGEELFTLGDACCMALDTGLPAGDKEGLKPKLKRARIIDKIMEALPGARITLPAEDVALIKSRVGEVISSAYVVNQICVMLDPATEEE